MANNILDIKDLTIHYVTVDGTCRAVNNVSLSLEKGETLGLVGETGAGKTTIALGILKLVPNPPGKIIGGEIHFDGEELVGASEEKMREIRGQKISMIFQDPMTALDPLFTVEYQLNEALRKHTKLNREERRKRMIELLELVEINQPERRLKQYPHELSGGMRQRVMIAMALSCDPDLLIADEPTTALDVTIQAQIVDLLKTLKDKLGMAIIFITHDLGVVADICDKIIVMYAGKIIEEGTSRQIFYDYQHPYTQGLLESVPEVDLEEGERLKPIPGNPPDMSCIREGCAFAERCPHAMQICVREDAPLFEIDETHAAACWKLLHSSQQQKG